MKRSDLPIALPGDEDWDTMTDEGSARFCRSCKKRVHDIGAMTELEARAFLATRADAKTCVRYLADRHGDVLFARAPSGFVPLANLRASKAKRALLHVGTIAVTVATLAACSTGTGAGSAPAPAAPEGVMMMGEISADPLPPSAAPSTPPSGVSPPPTASAVPAPSTPRPAHAPTNE